MKHVAINLTLEIRVLLDRIKSRLVVVGGVARVVAGEQSGTKDLDLLYDGDSARAYDEIRRGIARSVEDGDLTFESPLVGCWTFPEEDAGLQVEIINLHRGASYQSCARTSTTVSFDGVPLRVAEARKCK